MDNYKKLENQPLMFVLAEFQFSPVMQTAEFIPKIQEALRKQYPILDKRSEQAVAVRPSGIDVSSADQWVFISADKKSAIEISQERLIYITAEYPRFTGFSDTCKQAIDTLISIVEPNLILRIGLRYGDLVLVDDGESITDLVNEHFGLPSCTGTLGKTRRHSTETFLHTGMGGLVIRTLYGEHNLSCLPDAQELPISITKEETPSERIILDFDHFWEARDESVDFVTSDVLKKLAALHEAAREAFWKVTTDYARNEKWA